MFLLYNLVFTLAALLMTPYYLWRHRKTPRARGWWRERLGFLPPEFRQKERGAIWIHAVSVGETLAVAGLVKALAERHPEYRIFISHVTSTGREAGEKRLPDLAGRFYLPLDGSACVNRVLDALKPGLLLIVETELWPNLLHRAHRSGARVALVNARLSDRSFPGYRMFRPFMRRVLENVDWIFAQTPQDRERFCALGANPARAIAMGNLKFDSEVPEPGAFPELFGKAVEAARRSPVLVAASTMPGEEELVLKAWQRIRPGHPRGILVLAPRHPARFDDVAALLASARMSFIRRTSLSGHADAMAELEGALRSPTIVLLDTIGELPAIFALADVVFIGGSLVPAGGHNLIEPARSGKPVLFGPHMENFRDAAEIFLEAKAARRVRTWEQLAAEACHLFEADEERLAAGRAALRIVEQCSGATGRILGRVSEMLEEARPLGKA